jgi:hypothetical protein
MSPYQQAWVSCEESELDVVKQTVRLLVCSQMAKSSKLHGRELKVCRYACLIISRVTGWTQRPFTERGRGRRAYFDFLITLASFSDFLTQVVF